MIHLWQHFLQHDLDAFRQLLAAAVISGGPQRVSSGHKLASSSALPSTSPKTALVNKRRSSEKINKSSRPARKQNANSPQGIVITRADVNLRDAFGRTLLHHAASSSASNALGFVEALLQIPLVDLYIQDLENGWTPLHRALYRGHICVAQSLISTDASRHAGYGNPIPHHLAGGLVKIKDHEGLTPFELFALTTASRDLQHFSPAIPLLGPDDTKSTDSTEIDDTDTIGRASRGPSVARVNLTGDEMFAFGSNKNLNLGLGDEDDRQFPEQVSFSRPDQLLRRLRSDLKARRAKQSGKEMDLASRQNLDRVSALPATVVQQPILIQDVVMSKLHTAVITADPECNVYVCGYGPGGRLGTGDEYTRFYYVCLQSGALSRKHIVNIALGQDHSIAVSEQGEVFTWGSNKWGQLGYVLPQSPSSSNGDASQLTPRQLFGTTKKETIIGAAASSLHSAIFTSSAIYTFGKNEGQLGLMDADARSLSVQTIPRRVGVSILQSPILLVSAIDRATAILLETHEVVVLTHYGWTKLVFPLDRYPDHFLPKTSAASFDMAGGWRPDFILKITSGGNTICAMSDHGDVFAVDVGEKLDSTATNQSTTNPSKARNALPHPSKLWSTPKSHMAAKDLAVGQDGSIILCTAAGSVWRKEKRAKIRQVNLQGSIIRKSDYKFARVVNLNRVVGVRGNAYGAYTAVRKDCHVPREQIVVDPPSIWDTFFTMLPFRGLASSRSVGPDAVGAQEFRFWTPSTPISSPAHVKAAVLGSIDIESKVGALMQGHQPLTGSNYDLWVTSTISDVRIPVHSFLVKARSPVLRHALAGFQKSYYFSIPDVLDVEYGSDGDVHLQFQSVDFLTVLNYVLYLYTETVVDVWHHTQRQPEMTSRYRQIRTELMKIGNQLEMSNLERAARVMTEPARCLHLDMEAALKTPDFFTDTDVVILLANGRELPAHREILSHRCPFFEGLFDGRAGGVWLSSRRDGQEGALAAIRVDLKHVEEKIFAMVLRHLYADTGEELFDDVVTADLDEFLDVIFEVMAVSNELMLDRLTQVCQRLLGQHVTTRNICQLLNAVAACSVDEFKRAGLEYICLNLETMLEHRLLDELDADLMADLDEMVQENQLACQPAVRDGSTQAGLFDRHPELAEQVEQGKQRTIDSLRLRSRILDTDGQIEASRRSQEQSASMQLAKQPSASTLLSKTTPDGLPEPSSEMLFDMDEDHSSDDVADLPLSVSPINELRGKWLRGSSAAQECSSDVRLPLDRVTSHHSPSPSLGVTDGLDADIASPSSPCVLSRPWQRRSSGSPKTDLKSIMAQATASRTSSLTLAISQKAASRACPKLSQRQRKKIQHQHQQDEEIVLPEVEMHKSGPRAALQNPPSPWQVVPKERVPLISEEMLDTHENHQSSRSASRPAMTIRQPLADASAINAQDIPNKSPSQLRSVSMPSAGTSSSPRPAIQSIRHTPVNSGISSSPGGTSRSMAEILAQQQGEKRAIKEAAAKRSLQEIQQEQEFQEWWDHESEKVQGHETSSATPAPRAGNAGRLRSGRRGTSRGRGGGSTAASQLKNRKANDGASQNEGDAVEQGEAGSSRGKRREGRSGRGRGWGRQGQVKVERRGVSSDAGT